MYWMNFWRKILQKKKWLTNLNYQSEAPYKTDIVLISVRPLHHVAADVISFAATFLQKSPLTHFVAAPFQIATAALGFDLALVAYLRRVLKTFHRFPVGASIISLAPTYFIIQRARILSKSNPLYWTSIWLWERIWELHPCCSLRQDLIFPCWKTAVRAFRFRRTYNYEEKIRYDIIAAFCAKYKGLERKLKICLKISGRA